MTRVLLTTLLWAVVVTSGTTSASALELDGRKGVGYAQAIGGPAGLAFDYVVSMVMVEGIFGLSYTAFPHDGVGEEPEPDIRFTGALGAHVLALTAEDLAAVTVGGRINVLTGEDRSEREPREVRQFGIDVPVRIYWFPSRAISVHAEMGIAFLIGPEDGVLFGAKGGSGLVRDGLQVNVFDGGGPFGTLGLTFWW